MISLGMHETIELRAAVGRAESGTTWIDIDGTDARGRPMPLTIFLAGGLIDRADAIAAAINSAAGDAAAPLPPRAMGAPFEMPETFVPLGEAADAVVRGVAEVLEQEVAGMDATTDELAARRLELERGRGAGAHGDEPEAA